VSLNDFAFFGKDTCHLIIDIDVSLGWVEGYNEPPAVPTPSGGSLITDYLYKKTARIDWETTPVDIFTYN
jgi:hypothetical protein